MWIIIIVDIYTNLQMHKHNHHSWAPFQVASLLPEREPTDVHAWQISNTPIARANLVELPL